MIRSDPVLSLCRSTKHPGITCTQRLPGLFHSRGASEMHVLVGSELHGRKRRPRRSAAVRRRVTSKLWPSDGAGPLCQRSRVSLRGS